MPTKVREAIRTVYDDGWYLVRTTGSHRHFHHPVKPGTVTIPGHPSEDLKNKTWRTILRQAGLKRWQPMKLQYMAVFEQTPNNYCAYVPDVPGCISTGKTWQIMQEMIVEAVTGHIEVMLEYGDPLPQPRMTLEDALLHHAEPISEEDQAIYDEMGESPELLSTTFMPIEVEIRIPETATAAQLETAPANTAAAAQPATVPA